MGFLVKTLLLIGLSTVQLTFQFQDDPNPDDVIADATSRYIQRIGEVNAFKPKTSELHMETLYPKSEDSPLLVRKLRFPIQETVCRHSEDQQGKMCPLKENGKSTVCNMVVSQSVLGVSQAPDINLICEPMMTPDQSQQKFRVKRSKSKSGGKKRSGGRKGSRPGRMSLIASAGKQRGARIITA